MLLKLHTDSESAESNFKSGYSRKLRYLRKHQRVSLGFIGGEVSSGNVEVLRTPTDTNNTDIHTKPLDRVKFRRHAEAMGMHYGGVLKRQVTPCRGGVCD